MTRQQLFIPTNPEDPDAISYLEKILLDSFLHKELKKGSNLLFRTVIITIILDSNYQQGNINSAELTNRMNNWSGTSWIKQVNIYYNLSNNIITLQINL